MFSNKKLDDARRDLDKLDRAVFGSFTCDSSGITHRVGGLVNKFQKQRNQIEMLQKQNEKLMAVVAELVDYVYADKKENEDA